MSLDSAYELEIESSFLTKYPVFSYALPEFDSIQVMNNVNKSIRIQIENAYFTPAPRKDEPLNWSRQIIFDHKYILDDYTRFKTLKETFTEFIPQANVRNRRNPIIKAYFAFLPEEEKNQPLILLDGVFVSSEKLLEFNPYEIKSIELLNNRYYLGPHIADGVVDLKTVEGELGGFRLDENYHSMSNRGLKSSKVYSFPSYQNQLRDKIPDQRDQLYWNPSLRSRTDGRFGFSFYTSDVPGTYQVTVEGFNFSGEPITILESIQVIDEVK